MARPRHAAALAALLLAVPLTAARAQRAAATPPAAAAPRAARSDSTAAYGRRIQDQERRLKELRAQIEELRGRDRDLKRKERNTAEQLRLLSRDAALKADLLRTLMQKQDRVESQLDGIRAEHDRATEILAERRRRLARTLRAMYVRGTPTTAEVVLRAASLRYALSHFKYLEVVARNNERLVREIHEQEQYLAQTDAKLTETLYEVTTNAEEARQEKEQLAQTRRARQTALTRVRQQRAEYQKALADLAAAERKVQSVIAALEKRRQEAQAAGRTADIFPDVGFARLRGTMSWPVRGRVTAGFGRHKHPKHGTVTFNSGIDIAAAEGTDVRCVARGQVEYGKWIDGYGHTVIVNHGGGYYTLYAHLSETLVGESQAVEPGQVIGRVGDTGSLDGSKLHFEIRAKADPVDPRLWLAR